MLMNTKAKSMIGKITRKYGIYLVFFAFVIICSFLHRAFLSYKNIANVLRQASVYGILAFGESLVIISGSIDLSLGSVLALTGMVSVNAYLSTGSFLAAFLVAIIIGACCCGISGVLVSKVKLPPFVATLAMDNIARGAVFLYSGGRPIYDIGDIGKLSSNYFLKIPIPVYFLVAICIFTSVLLSKTTLGRNIYAVGGNAEAANAAGISVARSKILAYILCGIFAGIAGLLQMARINSALPDTGDGYHGDAIAAAVIGGISMSGGNGNAIGTFVGALIIAMISNILNLMGIQSYWQLVFKGIIIIAAVSFDIINKNRKIKKSVSIG